MRHYPISSPSVICSLAHKVREVAGSMTEAAPLQLALDRRGPRGQNEGKGAKQVAAA